MKTRNSTIGKPRINFSPLVPPKTSIFLLKLGNITHYFFNINFIYFSEVNQNQNGIMSASYMRIVIDVTSKASVFVLTLF